MSSRPAQRRAIRRERHPALATLTDAVRWSWRGRRWSVGLVLALVVVSALVAGTGHVVVPWLIYGGL